jgi:signal transduction histidine kinase
MHIRTAIVNLLRNALAFAEPGTKVEIEVDGSGDMVMLSVKNVGPEIPPDERELIFAPFARGSARGRSRNGSGLGLFIVRRAVEAHGGRISVESDVGSVTFRLQLPAGREETQRFAS